MKVVLPPQRQVRFPQVKLGQIGLLIGAVLLALIFGLVSSTGSIQFFMLMLGLLLLPLVLTLPLSWLIATQLAVVLVIAGCLQYFAKIHQAHWLPTLMFMALLMRVPAEAYVRSGRTAGNSWGVSSVALLLVAFVALFFISALTNAVSVMQGLVGLRHYVFPLAMTAVIAMAGLQDAFWQKAWKWLPWLLLLQLPVSLYQSVFVATGREQMAFATGISWDAVVGTFGGNAEGGGASGALALFLCFGIASVIALRRAELISKRLAVASCVAALATMLLAEVKVVAVFLPLAFLVLYRKRVLSSGLMAIGWGLASAAFVLALLVVYGSIFWKGKTTRSGDLSETLEYVLKAERDPRFFNRLTGEVSRYGALLLWYDENVRQGDAIQALVGHGPAASKISTLFGYGTAARKHPFQLTTSALSTVLWDLGILGCGLFFAACAATCVRACKQATSLLVGQPGMAAVFESLAIGMALATAGLAYNPDALNHPAVQALLAISFGLILRRGNAPGRPVRVARPHVF